MYSIAYTREHICVYAITYMQIRIRGIRAYYNMQRGVLQRVQVRNRELPKIGRTF